MDVALVTGSGGLIGSEAVYFFSKKGFKVVGIDNDMRKYFFGEDASTKWCFEKIKSEISEYEHFSIDIRDVEKLKKVSLFCLTILLKYDCFSFWIVSCKRHKFESIDTIFIELSIFL